MSSKMRASKILAEALFRDRAMDAASVPVAAAKVAYEAAYAKAVAAKVAADARATAKTAVKKKEPPQ